MVLDIILHLSRVFYWEESLSTENPVPLFVGIKPNFISVPHLSVFWLDVIEARGGVHNIFQRWIFFIITI